MNIHIVRLQDNKEIVGIFATESRAELFDIVDECTDPSACEFATLPSGGIMWPRSGSWPAVVREVHPEVPEDTEEEEQFWSGLFAGADFSGNWLETIFFDGLVWNPFNMMDKVKYVLGFHRTDNVVPMR